MNKDQIPTHFKELVNHMTAEWTESDGYVSAEFSTNPDYLHEKMQYLYQINREELNAKGGDWRLCMCPVCIDHNPKQPYHVAIHNL